MASIAGFETMQLLDAVDPPILWDVPGQGKEGQ
jgi:hypothetical protein